MSLSLPLWNQQREGVGARSDGAGSEAQDELKQLPRLGWAGLLFGARKGVVAEPLTDPFATDRNLSANAAPGECGAFPALAWDGGFELGFWNAFSSALATGRGVVVRGRSRCARAESESRRVNAQETASLCVGSSGRIRKVAAP